MLVNRSSLPCSLVYPFHNKWTVWKVRVIPIFLTILLFFFSLLYSSRSSLFPWHPSLHHSLEVQTDRQKERAQKKVEPRSNRVKREGDHEKVSSRSFSILSIFLQSHLPSSSNFSVFVPSSLCNFPSILTVFILCRATFPLYSLYIHPLFFHSSPTIPSSLPLIEFSKK